MTSIGGYLSRTNNSDKGTEQIPADFKVSKLRIFDHKQTPNRARIRPHIKRLGPNV